MSTFMTPTPKAVLPPSSALLVHGFVLSGVPSMTRMSGTREDELPKPAVEGFRISVGRVPPHPMSRTHVHSFTEEESRYFFPLPSR